MASAVEIAVETYIRAAGERNAQARTALLEACFAENGRMVTRSRELRGRAALAEMFRRFHSDPDVVGIRMLSVVDAQGTTFRFRSAVERRDGSLREAFDAGEVDENGQISLILTFAEPLADAPDADSPAQRSGAIDHTGIGVADVTLSAAFYDAALAPLGMRRVAQLPEDGSDAVAWGVEHPEFWIDRFHPHSVKNHTAFVAPNRTAVDAFHAAALAAGGTDNGAPGVRDTATGYPPGYYAAFVLDPDGNNVEALFRERSAT
ncbi:MAG TPA: VOC family protein [Polyangiaceae bacterium]